MKTMDYLKYLWRSTNEHGVHSPFVFSLVTRGLYKKDRLPDHPALLELGLDKRLPAKYLKALNNSLHHLYGQGSPKEIRVFDGRPAPTLPASSLLLVDLNSPLSFRTEDLLGSMHNDTTLLVLKKGSHDLWNALRSSEKIHLTIDCYRMGFIYKRPQQAKEDFTIRL